MTKYGLDEDKLKWRYKQIAGFAYVSSVSMSGIAALTDELVKVTLDQKYMGEAVPVINSTIIHTYVTILCVIYHWFFNCACWFVY